MRNTDHGHAADIIKPVQPERLRSVRRRQPVQPERLRGGRRRQPVQPDRLLGVKRRETMQRIHGGDIYEKPVRLDFSASLNPLGMPSAVRDAACRGVAASVHYPDVHCRALRRAIAGKENVRKENVREENVREENFRGKNVREEEIICGNGAAELIYALVNAVKPARALLMTPCFTEYESALMQQHCRIDYYSCREENGFAPDASFPEQITKEHDILFLCNPGNPTGVSLEPDFLLRVLDRCGQCGAVLAVDECFLGFMQDEEQRTMVPMLKNAPHLFILKAFTKLYAMPGLRLGYGLCHDRALLERMRDTLQPWNVSVPAQMAGEAAVAEQEYIRRTKVYIAEERAYLCGVLRQLGWYYTDSGANFIFFHGPADLAERLLSKGILIRDCSDFRGLSKGWYRIAVRSREENRQLAEAMKQEEKAQPAEAMKQERKDTALGGDEKWQRQL